MLQQVVEAYGCSLVEGVLSHQLKQFVIDGNKCVLNKVGTPNAHCCALEVSGQLCILCVQYSIGAPGCTVIQLQWPLLRIKHRDIKAVECHTKMVSC